ncbi:70 kDa neurofilament protein-like isoform X1 [Mya arenaria]|uniref:70 kDa neurofilament protein-like isoform X1 n=1 Tax=Mya arenaria TaxID=6604 RepID=UPI0022DE98EC|nr:70 kDa neurofilament protein-like isoform X1 [Mya arenaria]
MSVQTTIETTRKRQSMGPTQVIVQRSTPGSRMSLGSSLGSSSTMRRNVVQSSFSAPTRSMGEAGRVSKESVATVMNTRGKEKKDLGDLNSKLASYIDKVKYMEACNKAMTEEIDRLRKMKGYTQDRVKQEYEDELNEARNTIKTLSKEIAPLQARILALEDKVESKDAELDAVRKQKEELQSSVHKMTQLISELEGELSGLRGRVETVERDNEMLKSDVQRARDEADRIRDDFEAAVSKQILAENERDFADEERQFISDTLNAECEELRELLDSFKSVTPDIAKMWKSEFSSCIQAIQAEYNDQLAKMTDSTERRYQDRIMQMENAYRRDNTDSSVTKTENKTLKSAIGDQKGKMSQLQRDNDRLLKELEDLKRMFEEQCEECEEEKSSLRLELSSLSSELSDVMADLENMRGHNLSLSLEISCYRKLLEGEENSMKRIIEDTQNVQSGGGADLSSLIMSSGGSASRSGGGSSSQQSTMSESTGLVRVSRSSKCAISIAEIAQDGTFVRLKNESSSKDFDMSNWSLERKHPKGKSSFKLPDNFKLSHGKSIKIYANSFEDDAGPNDFVAPKSTCKSWGVGSGQYTLHDDKGAEKANSKIDFQTEK